MYIHKIAIDLLYEVVTENGQNNYSHINNSADIVLWQQI